MSESTKARPHSSIKVPDDVPRWKQALWRRIWRAAFMVIQDETLSRRIANGVIDPSAIKDDSVVAPEDLDSNQLQLWIKTCSVANKVCQDITAAKEIADNTCNYQSGPTVMVEASTEEPVDEELAENMPVSSSVVAPATASATASANLSNAARQNILVQRRGGSVKPTMKAVEGRTPDVGFIEGYLVSWGSTKDTDLQGEFFSPNTEFCLDWFQERPVLYHHGMDNATGLKKIGTFSMIKTDDIGLWVQAQLDLRDRYARAVYDMVKSTDFGWSSGSVDHLVKIGENGEILVWPLIEGSITPTPAQPAKTTVRPIKYLPNMAGLPAADSYMTMQAFKAVVGDDEAYLRGLNDHLAKVRVEDAEKRHLTYQVQGVKSTMGNKTHDTAWYITRAVAKGFGITDATSDELKAVAKEVGDVINDEINTAAAMALEEEAAQLSDEEVVPPAAASFRSRQRRQQAYRDYEEGQVGASGVTDQLMVDDDTNLDSIPVAEDPALAVASYRRQQRRAQRNAAPATMTDPTMDPATMTDDELEAVASRALRQRVWKRAIRQIVDAPVAPIAAPPAVPTMADEIVGDAATAMDEEVIKDIATASYRRGFRSGIESAYRNVDPTPAALAVQEDAAVASEVEAVSESTASTDIVDEAARAYRVGYRRGLAKAVRQLETETAAEDATASDEVYSEPSKSQLRRKAEAARRARAIRQFGDDEAIESDDELPVPAAASYRRRALRNALPDEALAFDEDSIMDDPAFLDDATMDDALLDEALAGDDDFAPESALMGDELAAIPSKNYRRPQGRATRSVEEGFSSYDYAKQVQYWKNRALQYEQAEAPNQRSFKSLQSVRDVADRPGSYNHAFKSYIYKGLGMLTDTEKYILNGKGKARWDSASFAYDSSTKSVKTYTTGSDASVGFLVPEDWVNELNSNVMTQTVMAPECLQRTTTSDRMVQPNLKTSDARRAHAAQVRWAGESPTSNANHRSPEDEYSQITIPVHVMMISLPTTNSALEDSAINLEDEINQAFAEAVAISYDQLIWGGDGQNKMEGVVVNNLVNASASAGVRSVGGYVATGSPDGIVTADTLKTMLFHMPALYRQRSKWYMNSNTGLEISKLKDGEGNYLIDQRDESLKTMGVPDRLLGRPIVYNEWADDIEEGSYPIFLSDMNKGYVIVRRVEFSIRRFDDSGYAEHDQVLFLGRARLGGQVLQPAAFKLMKVAAS